MTAGANKFLRIYYGRVKEISFHHFQNPNSFHNTSLQTSIECGGLVLIPIFSTCIKFSIFINLALTFYLQASLYDLLLRYVRRAAIARIINVRIPITAPIL